jgi:hypothetical protein
MACFRTDRQNAQRLLAERRQRRHLLEKGDVFFETHDTVYSWMYP